MLQKLIRENVYNTDFHKKNIEKGILSYIVLSEEKENEKMR